MKHLKHFESILDMPDLDYYMEYIKTNEPQVDDYVICKIDDAMEKERLYFENTILQIQGIDFREDYPYNVILNNFEFNLKRSEIIHHSKNKEDLEVYLTAKKYNL